MVLKVSVVLKVSGGPEGLWWSCGPAGTTTEELLFLTALVPPLEIKILLQVVPADLLLHRVALNGLGNLCILGLFPFFQLFLVLCCFFFFCFF